MRYVSLFSGVEAASVAWSRLGWEPLAFAEVDEFPSAVLACRFPDVPNLGDVCKIDWKEFHERYGAVDVLVGGSPCQSFSIAGNRTGLEGASGLMWQFCRAIRELVEASGGGAVPDTCYGRTFRELCQAVPKARRGRTSDACSESWKSAGMVWHGEFWTASLPEYQTGRRMDSRGRYRNAAGASSLSEVLVPTAPETYSLSARACEGIIRRAAKRGKPLPEILRAALEWVIAQGSSTTRESQLGGSAMR